MSSAILFQWVELTSMPDPLRASDLVTSAMLVRLTIDVVSCAAKMMMKLR
jgi:hypothetical protein